MSSYNPNTAGSLLYVATGIAAPDIFNAPYPDRLTTIDTVTPTIISQTPIPGKVGISNEPHHLGKTKDGVAFGGLLSVAHQLLFNESHPDIFYFDTTNPQKPQYQAAKAITFNHSDASKPHYCAATDEFISLDGPFFPKGTYAVTMMGDGQAGSPGKVAIFDIEDKLMGTYPDTYPDTNFNPHGIWYNAKDDLLMTSDYVVPISAVVGPPVWRYTMRIWEQFSVNRAITKTITVSDSQIHGLMSVVMIPDHPKHWSYVCGSGHMYLIKPDLGTAELIFILPVEFSGFITINKEGTRLTAPLMNDIAYISIDDPEHPFLCDLISIDKYWQGDYQSRIPVGPHYSRYSLDGKWLYTTNYFITTPIITDMGDKKLWRCAATQDELINDPSYEIDFLKYHPIEAPSETIEAHPHSIQIVLPQVPVPFDPTPIVLKRSPQTLKKVSSKCLRTHLYTSIEGWLINAMSAIRLAYDIKSTNQMNYTVSFNSCMRSANKIGRSYDVVTGKEQAGKLIRSIFLFSSQAMQVMADVLANHESSYNQALLEVRLQDLAVLLANTFYLDYSRVLKLLEQYKQLLLVLMIEVRDNVTGTATADNIINQALLLGQYLANGIISLHNHICEDNADKISYKGLIWVKYGFALEMLIAGYPYDIDGIIANISAHYTIHGHQLQKYLRRYPRVVATEAWKSVATKIIQALKEYRISQNSMLTLLEEYHNMTMMTADSLYLIGTTGIEIAALFPSC